MVSRITESNRRMTQDAVRGAQQTSAAVRQWETSITGVGTAVRTLASAFAALQVANFVGNFSAFAEQLNETSKRTGILVEDLHALERVGKLEGATFEEITTGLRFLNKAMAESSDAGSEQAKIFKLLGVDVQSITKNGGGAYDVLLKLSDAFKNNLDVSNRYLVAQKLLGRSSEGLINVLVNGSSQIQDWVDEQKRLGVITSETAAKADDARDKWEIFKGVLQAKVGGPAIDFLTDMIARLQELGPWIVWFSERVQKGAEILDGWRAALERAGDATRNWATGASQSVAELSRQLEHLQRFAPGDIAPQNRLRALIDQKTQGALVDLERGAGFDGALSTNLLARSKQIDVAKQLADQEKAAAAAKKLASEREAAAKKAVEDAKRFTESIQKQNDAISLQIIEMTQGEAAADEWKLQLLEAEASQLKLTEAQRKNIDTQRTLITGLREQKEHLAAIKVEMEFAAQAEADLAAVRQASDRDNQLLIQRAADLLEIEKQVRDVQIERIAATGQTVAADRARFENQIRYLEELRKREEGLGNAEKANLHAEQIKLAQTQLQSLGEVSINVGQTIANSVGDAFEGVILGTSKLADVGKNLFNALVRDVAQFFTNVMVKKLGFENLIFTNLRGFGGQANSALASGLSAGGAGGNPFLSMLFGGGAPAGVQGPLMQNGSFFSGGGGILQSLGIGDIGQKIAGLFGTSGGGQGLFGGIGTFFSDIGSGNSILGSFGGPLLGGAAALITAGFMGGFKKSKIGSTIGSTVGGAIGSIWGPIGTFVGATIGNLIGSLFNTTPNPTAILKAQFSGIFFDAIDQAFKPGSVSVGKLSAKDIGRGRVEGLRTEVQQALQGASQQWTDILNAFGPSAVNAILPTLAGTNANLNNAFGRLKFSEGGKRSIDEELAAFTSFESGTGFFHAMRASIGAGFEAALNNIGLSGSAEQAREQFTRGVLHRGNRPEGGVMMFPGDAENATKFINSITDLARLTASINEVSPRGIAPFITDADRQFLEHGFGTVFGGGSDPLAFIKNTEGLKEKIAPVLDFLKQAVGESTTIFGRGLVAALDAATQSDAKAAFMQSLGDGTKEIIFKGITEAFLASAQFNDLLAPIQQTIRGFTQQAIATGQTPDLNAFRAALLPQVEALSARGEALAPLLLELQKLGLSFNDALKAFVLKAAPKGPTTIKIDIFAGNKDVKELANELDDHLRALLGPS